MQPLLTIIGLGLLAIDPVEAMLVASAIMARTKKSKIVLFTLTFILGTAGFGVILSLLGQGAIDYVRSIIPSDTSPLWAILNIVIIAAVIVWLVIRFTRRNKPSKKEKKQLFGNTWSFVAAALLLAVSALADPTFYAVILTAAETHNVFAMIGLNLLWIIIGESPLVILFIAYLFNAHKPLLKYTSRFWEAHKQKLIVALYCAAILLALVLLTDTIVYLATGAYWF